MYVDSHCHLSFPELFDRVHDIRAAMRAAQVTAAVCICTTIEEFDRVNALASEHPDLWCTVGVHPDSEGVLEPSIDDLCRLAARDRVVGIGETGLDYYRLNGRGLSDMEWQRERFRVHIRAARLSGKPLVVHTRNSAADTLAIILDEGGGSVGGVFHCFTESLAVARAVLDLGFHISFSGIITFKNADALREVARYAPLERCLIETDSPYLAPVPYRGKVNSPAYVPWVARQMALIKGVSVEDVAQATRTNFARLFGVPEEVLLRCP